jgi:DNA-directed RNA polymerase specialized sigma24 family protein
VREALQAAPEHCREVVDRFFCRDESYATIAAALDLPAGTIASRISRCLAGMRKFLEGKKTAPSPV